MTQKEKNQYFEKLEDFLEKQKKRIEKLKEKCDKDCTEYYKSSLLKSYYGKEENKGV